MKKLIFAILAIVGLSVNSNAQANIDFKPVTLLSIANLATTITNSATSNYTATASIGGANKVGIGVKVQLNGAGTGDNIFKFALSSDGVNYETTPSILITNASAGTTATYYFNTATVSGARSIKLTSVVNGTAAALTNVLVTLYPVR